MDELDDNDKLHRRPRPQDAEIPVPALLRGRELYWPAGQICAPGRNCQGLCTQGFAEITSEYAVVLVSTAEKPEEIDAARAQRAKERAEERLRQHESQREYFRSKAALARATARLRATSHKS